MGTVTLQHTVNTAYTTEVITIPTENQLVYSINAQYLSHPTGNFSPYVSVGLLQGGTGLIHLSALLASGHPHSGFPIGWSGAIPTQAEMHIFAAIYAPVGTPILLSAYLLPYIITPERGLQLVP